MLNKKLSFVVTETSKVVLKIYDNIGNLVATPVNENKPAGVYSVNLNTTLLPGGIYSYEVFSGGSLKIRKIEL